MTSDGFTPKRLTRRYTQTIDAAPERVFPLLCPVREAEWLDGWRYTMIRSESGLAEAGAVFTPPRHIVEFVRFTHQSRVCVLRIAVRPSGERRSLVDVAYTYTSVTPAGNGFIDAATEESFLGAVTFWERSMNHWLATGRRLMKT